MIFDDYWYRRPDLGRSVRPKLAVDGFVGAMSHQIKVLDVAAQVFLQKKRKWASWIALLSLINPTSCETAYLDWIEMIMWT